MKQLINNLDIYRGIGSLESDEQLKERLRQPSYLLYPGANAADAEEIVLNPQSNLVVVDGTWREARKILHVNPWLHDLPKVTFKKQQLNSNYRIRQQPKGKTGYLCSLEACTYFLQLNYAAQVKKGLLRAEDQPNYQLLLDVFDKMVSQQVQCIEQSY